MFRNGLSAFFHSKQSAGATRRRRCSRRMPDRTFRPTMEMLESRLMLAGDFHITALNPIGAAGNPFSTMEISFNRAVDETTFTVDDVLIGGTGSPTVDGIARLEATRYQISLGGTGLGSYSLSIGPAIVDTLGTALDQDGDGTPGETDEDVYVAALFSAGLTIGDGDTTYDGQNLVISGGAATVDGPHSFSSLAVLSGAMLTHSPTDPAAERRLELAITDRLWIDGTSKIDVTGRGYTDYYTIGNTTTGGATGSSGGSYGGLGVSVYGATNASYGDFRDPNAPGSGGGGDRDSAGSGGGLVRITAGSAAIDGSILANGGDGLDVNYRTGGGGSGGGILLDIGTLAGSGVISAGGGRGYASATGGGGGGRVAIYYDALDGFDLTSQVTAHGGNGASGPAAVGSVYMENATGHGVLRIDSHGTTAGTWTPLGVAGDTAVSVDELVLSGSGVTAAPEHEMSIVAGSVSVLDGAMLTHRHTTTSQEYSLRMTISGQLLVDSLSRIDVSGRGYGDYTTVGNTTTGGATGTSGGSYGGLGVNSSGYAANPTYGDFRNPDALGSGGAGDGGAPGSGGGLIRITAASATIDGTIAADGENGVYANYRTGGGGSGGGILLDVGTLAGSGTISADGGQGYDVGNGSGGGGRVAVYYDTLAGFDLASQVTAHGGGGSAGPAAAGTVYLETASGRGTLRIDSHSTTAGSWTPLGVAGDTEFRVDELILAGAGVIAAPEHEMTIHADNVQVLRGAVLTHRPTTTEQVYSLRMQIAGDLTVDAASLIDVTGYGYIDYYTNGNTTKRGATGSSGGSYGGRGSNRDGVSSTPYGRPDYPSEPGSGGAGERDSAGSGGGVIHITAATITVDGRIAADGQDGIYTAWRTGGGGSGGAILLNAVNLTGSGQISADGGNGYDAGNGAGGGGRVAVYHRDSVTLPEANITANGGTVGSSPGEEGSVLITSDIHGEWLSPRRELVHGVATIGWEYLAVDPAVMRTTLTATRHGQIIEIASGRATVDSVAWDTTSLADGIYQLRLTLRDTGGPWVHELNREVLVDNSVHWHSGRVTEDETWDAAKVHVVDDDLVVAAGVTVTLAPGAIVKFVPGVDLTIEDGATLDASGATADLPVVFTALADDTAGGDTNRDGTRSRPVPGSWDGMVLKGTGRFLSNEFVESRYSIVKHEGTLASDEVWMAGFLHHITGRVTVPAGVTLTIEPGAVVKFDAFEDIIVQGTLIAEGAVAQPVMFTSILDDSVAGDTNRDGENSQAAAGNWRSIEVAGTARFDHAHLVYGGGTLSGTWEGVGALRTHSGSVLTFSNSVLRDAFFDGILAWGGDTTVTNSVIAGADRGISAHPDGMVHVVNSTLDDNRIGLLVHGGKLDVTNSLVTNSLQAGIQFDFTYYLNPLTVRSTDVWSTTGSNYVNTADQTGTNGNVSVDPKYKNRAQGNYRLGFGSPVIDAADGGASPATDFMGAPRYDDPRTANTGVAISGGAVPDLGAFEFVESSTSDYDLVVTSVVGPTEVLPGQTARVQWTVRNADGGAVEGAWHDAIRLVSAGLDGESLVVPVGEVLSSGKLGPGGALTFTADVVVPPAADGLYRWEILTNSRGEIFEGIYWNNNRGQAALATSLLMPELALGETVLGSFSGSGDRQYFKIRPAEGQDVRLVLDRGDSSGRSAIYVRRGELPTRQTFDLRAAGNSPDATLMIPSAQGDEYYVMLDPSSIPGGSAAFAFVAEAADFGLASIGVSAGSNLGTVSIPLVGAGFRDGMQLELVAGDGTVRAAESVTLIDSTSARARFNLAGLATGLYDVRIAPGGLARTLEDVFTVNADPLGRVETRVSVPEIVRIGREFTAWIEYTNVGATDVTAPLIYVSSTTGNLLRFDGDDEYQAELAFIGVGSRGEAGMLAPGETGRIAVRTVARSGANTLQTRIATTDNPTTIDWEMWREEVRPDTATAEWDDVWNTRIRAGASTVGELVQMFSRAATRYAELMGSTTCDTNETLRVAVLDALQEDATNLSLYAYLDHAANPLSAVIVTATEQTSGEVYAAYAMANGLARFTNLPDGTYNLAVPGYLEAGIPLDPVTISGNRVDVGPWILWRGGQIRGRLAAPGDTQYPSGQIAIAAVDEEGNTSFASPDAEGRFSFSGLVDGTYSLHVSGAGIAPLQITGIAVVEGAITELQPISLLQTGSVSGVVRDAASGQPLSGITITLLDTDHAITVATGEDGTFLLEGVPVGTQQITANGDSHVQAVRTVVVEAGQTTGSVDFTLQRSAVVSGTVTFDGVAVAEAGVSVKDGDGTVIGYERTGADGTYRIADLDPAGYTLEVDHWRYAVHSQSITLTSGDSATRDVALVAAGMVSGTLTETTTGLPMNNMAVLLLRPDGSITPTTTAVDGTFAFSRLDPGSYTVMLPDGSHRQTFSIAGPDDHVSVAMNMAVGGLTGVVVGRDGVLPVTNATAWLIKDGQVVLSSGVDDSGRFLQLLVSPGVYDLYVASPDYVYAVRSGITITGGQVTDLETFYPGGATLIVTLRDAATGEIFTAGGALAVRPVGIPDAVAATRWIAIGSSGIDALQDLELGQYRVMATAAGKTVVDTIVTVEAGFETIDVNLADQATLSGTVTASGGGAVESISVLAYDPAHPELVWEGITDESGVYQLGGLPAGQYTVVFTDQRVEESGDRYRLSEITGVVIAAGQSLVRDAELTVADTALSGSITTADSSPPLGATIEILNGDGVVVAVVSADTLGQYTVTTLSGGDYTVRGTAKGYVLGTAAVTLVAGTSQSGIDLAATWYADPFSWLTDLYAAAEAWATQAVQSMLDGLARILGEPQRAPYRERSPQSIPCPIADQYWAWVEHYQKLANQQYDAWHTRWEAAVGIGSANLGMFGVQLGTLAAQLYIAQNMPPDAYGAMFASAAGRLKADLGLGRISAAQYESALAGMRATYDAMTRMFGANVMGGIGTGVIGEWVNVSWQGKTTIGIVSDAVGKLMADGTDWASWLELASGLGELGGYLDTIIGGLNLMGQFVSWWDMAKFNTYVGILKVFKAAADGVREYIEGKNELIRMGEEYERIIFKRDKEYYNYLRALADCRDKDDDKPNPNPIPAPSTLPPGGLGTAGGGGSVDPNDKATIGYGAAGWIGPQGEIFYKIRFENLATAELPAQEVVVTDTLDASLDWSTLELVGIGFNGTEIEIPAGLREFTTRVTVESDPNPVDVNITFNPDTGLVTWTMRSVDAATGELPEDPLAGFLPPNDDQHRGEGYVTFRIRPVSGLANGAAIENWARIVFDVNEPIDTNVVVNTIDTVAPTSQVAALSAETALSSVLVSWSGSDDGGSGVAAYDLFVSDNGGAFELWLAGTTETSATFVGTPGHTYAFYSVATDGVGRRESAPNSADAQTTLGSGITLTEAMGAVSYAERQDLNPGAGILWYSFQPIRDGWVTLLAESSDPLQTVRMVLTDANGNVLTYSSLIDGRQRIDTQSTAGTSYLVGLMGTSTGATLHLANLVHQAGATVTVYGTDAADTFEISGGSVRRVSINGFDYRFLSTAASLIRFDGAAGDTALLRGSSAAETVELRPGSATLTRTGLEVQVTDVAQIAVMGGGGSDVVALYDSPGDDRLIATTTWGRFSGDGFDNRVEGFSRLHAYATSGGQDTARLFGCGEDDLYLGRPRFGRLIGGNAEVSVRSFEQVAIDGRGGHDTARLVHFGRNEVHIDAPRFGRLGGADAQVSARSFDQVVAGGKSRRNSVRTVDPAAVGPEANASQAGLNSEDVGGGVYRVDTAHSDSMAGGAGDPVTESATAGNLYGELYVANYLSDASTVHRLLRHAHLSEADIALLVTAGDGLTAPEPASRVFRARDLARARIFRELSIERRDDTDSGADDDAPGFGELRANVDAVDWVLQSVKRWL